MRWSIGTKIGAGFGAAMLLLVVTDVLAYRITTGLIAVRDQEERSLKILEGLEEILSSMRAAEAGERGFVITGDPAYLDRYASAAKDIGNELGELRQIEALDPMQLRGLDALADLIKERRAQLDETIAVRKTAGLGAAVRRIQTNRGKKSMDAIEQTVARMGKEEEGAYARRDAAADAHARASLRLIEFGSLSALLVLAGVTFVTTRSITRPVRRLVAGTDEIGSGMFEHRVAVTTKDEIGSLAIAFNHMAERLQRDSAERNRVQEALNDAKQAADRANLAKSEFLSRMSHELRTPLNAILGFAQLLEMDSLTPEQREGVEHILKGGRHLLDLINEVLDIARIEAGRLAVSLEPVSVQEVTQEALDLIRPLATELDVWIEQGSADGSGLHILADRQRLTQVLLNLLGNAVKYNSKGGRVTLSCQATPGGPLRISVVDTGPGIPPDQLERLFIPFERLGAEETAVEGTGLGLALSKRLVGAMDGTLGVESTVGRGSTFWVEFPVVEGPVQRLKQNGADVPDPVELKASHKARVVLYVEDNLSNLKLVRRLMAHRPEVRLVPAMQGQTGLDLARKHRPDLILLDLHLPDLSGLTVLHRLREEPETRDIPVVLISADATPGQIERLLAAGAHSYLTKPLDIRKFLALLDEILSEE